MQRFIQLALDLFDRGPVPAPGAERMAAPAPAPVPVVAPAAPAEPLDRVLAPAQFGHPRANRRAVLCGTHVAYEFRRGRRRTIGFVVGPEGLVVSAPRWVPVADVETALREKAAWIVRKLDEQRERQGRLESARIDWRDGTTVPFLGEPVIVVLDPRQTHGASTGAALHTEAQALPGVPSRTLHLGLPQHAEPAQIRDAAQAWLMRQARRIFTERLDHFAPQLGVQWKKLSLSSASTRWGSASADGSIRLNWRLVHLGMPVIDYVVVHELSHLRVMDHSPRFWDTVRTVMPDYARRRGQLKDEAVPPW